MPWVRIDEEFPHHPKVVKAGPLGMAMQVAALCYCNRYLTDGFVPRSVAATLLDFTGLGMRMWMGELTGGGEDASWKMVVEDLEDAGLWEQVEGGWQIHDYHDYQPSRDYVLKLRETRKGVGSKGGKASGEARRKQPRSKLLSNEQASTQATDEATAEANGEPKTNPVPGPVPPSLPPSLTAVPSFTGVGDMPVENPDINNRREGKGRTPRTPRHPTDDYVIRRARQIQAESGVEAARAYIRKVGETYGIASKEDQLRRLEAIMAQDQAEAGEP